jgi:glycoside/pentoside/hexuronide:cation symporter, GPH family
VFWAVVSRFIGKKWTYIFGMLIGSCGSFALWWVEPGFPGLIIAALLATGLGAGAGFLIPSAMIPDVVEMDERRTGLRREAMFYSCYLLLEKLGIALAGSISSYTLSGLGYINPRQQRQSGGVLLQPDGVLLALRIFVCIVPLLLRLLAVPLALSFPYVSRKYQIDTSK